MAIKPNFLTSMGYHIFLTVVLRARAPLARAKLRYDLVMIIRIAGASLPYMYDIIIIITVCTTASITFFASVKLGLIKLVKKPVARMAKTFFKKTECGSCSCFEFSS